MHVWCTEPSSWHGLAARALAGSVVAVGALAIAFGLVSGSSAAGVAKTTVVLGRHRLVARPLLPGAALPGGRQRHRLPGQQRPDQQPFLVPRTGTIKAWTLTLAQPTNSQRAFFNGFFGTPPEARICDPAPGSRHQPAPLLAARPGRDQGALALPRPDGQVRLQPRSRKERHRRPHRADLGADLLPRAWPPTTSGGPAAKPATAPTRPTSARANRRKSRTPRDLRLQVHDGAVALHGDAGRGSRRSGRSGMGSPDALREDRLRPSDDLFGAPR